MSLRVNCICGPPFRKDLSVMKEVEGDKNRSYFLIHKHKKYKYQMQKTLQSLLFVGETKVTLVIYDGRNRK
jgi:hypothetical protein